MAPVRVIALALLMGQVLFAGLILFLHQTGTFKGDLSGSAGELLRMVALVFGFAVVPLALVLRGVLWRRADTLPESQRPQAHMAATITSLALLEAGALFNLVIWLVTGVPMPNVALVGLLVAVQLYLFPRA